jgi:hypothetical protein
MNVLSQHLRRSLLAGIAMASVVLAGCAQVSSTLGMGGGAVRLSGDQEVPAVMTSGSGSGTITMAKDGSLSGSVTTKGVPGVAAHIHYSAMGKNGPVIVPLTKSGDSTWMVPAGAKLNDTQMSAYKAGDLYVNVHTAAHKGGEVRGQIKP